MRNEETVWRKERREHTRVEQDQDKGQGIKDGFRKDYVLGKKDV
jgi:hypothetical protein